MRAVVIHKGKLFFDLRYKKGHFTIKLKPVVVILRLFHGLYETVLGQVLPK